MFWISISSIKQILNKECSPSGKHIKADNQRLMLILDHKSE